MAGPLSTSGVTPDDYVANTELEAVWYAANQYYEASFRRNREYGGRVFVRPDGKFVVTGYRGSEKRHIYIRDDDGGPGYEPVAIWHTHLPGSSEFVDMFDELLGIGQKNISDDDLAVGAKHTKKYGRTIYVYLVTATVIKRYRPGSKEPLGVWSKNPPEHMKFPPGMTPR